jgi:GDP-L-fucose synthase
VLWGTGKPMREFLHVDDLADAVVYLLENKNADDLRLEVKKNNRIQSVYSHLNIGCGEDISIKNLALLVKKIIGFEGIIEFDTLKPDGTPKKQLDVSRLFNLRWRPKISLEEGIRKVYNDYTGS